MKVSQCVRGSFIALCLVVIAASVFAQAQQPEGFQPQVGQSGKDVVWVPTPQALVDKMLDIAKVTPEDYVIDLGSGDGRTVITAAKRGATARGIEYNPDMVALSKRNAEKEGVSEKATFVNADLFTSDFSKATVITMFLLPSINLKLRPKILDLKPGTRIVSNTFTMDDWEPDETATVDADESSYNTALLWIVPAKVAGAWKMSQGILTLKQEFQKFSGTLKSDRQSKTIENGLMRGDRISFSIEKSEYSGRVNGSAMVGTVTTDGTNSSWSAKRAE